MRKVYFCLIIFQLIFTSLLFSQSYLDKLEKLILSGDFDLALNYAYNCLNTSPPSERPSLLLKISLINWILGNLSDCYNNATLAYQLSKKTLNKNVTDISSIYLKILDLYNRGKSLCNQGLYQQSIQSFKEAIKLSQLINSPHHELKCRRLLSISYWSLNDYYNFFNENMAAWHLAKSLNHKKEQCRCLNNLGLAYWKFDNYNNALNFFFEALKIAKSIKSSNDESDIISNIALVYRDIGNFEKAIEFIISSIILDEKNCNKRGLFINRLNLGFTYRHQFLSTGNKLFIEKAINIYKQLLNEDLPPDIKVKVLNNIASAYNDIGLYHNALYYLNKSLEYANLINNLEEKSIIYNNLGIVNYNLGNYEKAIDFHNRSIEIALYFRNGQLLWEAYLDISNVYKKLGDYDSAIFNLKNSISILENIRSLLSLEEYKYSFLASSKRLNSYYNLIDLLIKKAQKEHNNLILEEALFFLEKARARSFLDSIELSKIHFKEDINQQLKYKEAELMNEISNLYTKLINSELSNEQRNKLFNKLNEVEQDLENVRREMRKNNPAYANLQFPQFVTLEEAQKKIIPKKTLVLSYLISTEASYVFAITNKYFKIFPLPKENEIKGLVRNYLMKLTDPDTNNFSEGHELYLVLMDQALRSFNGIKRIIIIPDDLLHYLPFESLLISKNGKYKWLIENYAISYAPSLTSIKEIKERKKTNGDRPKKYLLAIGSPKFDINGKDDNNSQKVILNSFYEPGIDLTLEKLQFSTQEIKSISSYFPIKKSKILIHEDASEEIIKGADLSEYKILHFATHCIIDDKKPARSSIVLRLDQDPQEDGFLQVREIFNLKLNADLVTLSACQTGIGPLIRGEGIDGLNRAFFYAGASSLILSLWPINDQATSQLMQRFYFYVKNHNSIELALQKAKLELINSGTLSHPYYWAAFIPYGDTNIITIKKDIPPIIFASLLLLFIILCFLIRKKIFEFDTTILLTKMVHSWSKGNKDISTISTTESSNYMEFQK